MGVLTNSLVPSIKRATSPPGTDLYPDSSAVMWQGYIEDAFYSAVLKGLLSGYGIDLGTGPPTHAFIPTPPNTTELPGWLGQLIVEFAALNVTTSELMALQTQFKAVAGPVQFEVQRSATVLVAVLKSLESQIALSIQQIGSFGYVNTAVLDAVIDRTYSIALNGNWWVR